MREEAANRGGGGRAAPERGEGKMNTKARVGHPVGSVGRDGIFDECKTNSEEAHFEAQADAAVPTELEPLSCIVFNVLVSRRCPEA